MANNEKRNQISPKNPQNVTEMVKLNPKMKILDFFKNGDMQWIYHINFIGQFSKITLKLPTVPHKSFKKV